MSTRNRKIAAKLREIAELLQAQKANPFRRNAYLHAADTLERLPRDVGDILASKGIKGLVALPGIGNGIARAINEYLASGRISRLDSLRGGSDPVALLQTIPTVGPELAQRIHDVLHVDSLEALENEVHAGRLGLVGGIGQKRGEAIEAWLQTHLGQRQRPAVATGAHDRAPDIALLLRVDADYRRKASEGKLPSIAPRRFNPENKAWLPILHTTRAGWHFTALFSNTARAHELKRTHDWVVIYFYDDHHQEGQHTVVTEHRGRLKGRRVVRGREQACVVYYDETGR